MTELIKLNEKEFKAPLKTLKIIHVCANKTLLFNQVYASIDISFCGSLKINKIKTSLDCDILCQMFYTVLFTRQMGSKATLKNVSRKYLSFVFLNIAREEWKNVFKSRRGHYRKVQKKFLHFFCTFFCIFLHFSDVSMRGFKSTKSRWQH